MLCTQYFLHFFTFAPGTDHNIPSASTPQDGSEALGELFLEETNLAMSPASLQHQHQQASLPHASEPMQPPASPSCPHPDDRRTEHLQAGTHRQQLGEAMPCTHTQSADAASMQDHPVATGQPNRQPLAPLQCPGEVASTVMPPRSTSASQPAGSTASPTDRLQDAADAYTRPFLKGLPPGYMTVHGHMPSPGLAPLGTVDAERYMHPWRNFLPPGYQPPHPAAVLPASTITHPAAWSEHVRQVASELIRQQQAGITATATVPTRGPCPGPNHRPAVVHATNAGSSGLQPSLGSSLRRPIPNLSTFSSVSEIWQAYDVGIPHQGIQPWREQEDSRGAEWRNQRSKHDRKRWSDINCLVSEIQRRAGEH